MSSISSMAGGATQSVGFLLLDKFTLMSLASAVEPLRMANQLTGRTLYRWHTFSPNGAAVWASDGAPITPDGSWSNPLVADTVIYYLRLRLIRARQLLKQTSLSIVELAYVCGFVSTPHFSKCYREHFGVPPSDERSGSEMSRKPIAQPSAIKPLTTLDQARNESTFASVRMMERGDLASTG
ncbi:helix-turn-helix domain-containing protein [Pseudomonas fluorescens]|uniref:HTH araC/xylS-type domain-containing protein n=1 Tax=Pseudomonas fluorescens TaxID=294 RepID=A0A423MCU4_PSEFL|nr:helix-turn-helix domain-containing protein [Pseudomonas fluorescens]RON81086.1 hypothetical protein BK670_12960 [Pseudomonas fluorescens]